MKFNTIKLHNRNLRKRRIRSTVIGSTNRPRLSVFISNQHVTAQLIDDSKQMTLAYATSVGSNNAGSTMSEKAVWVGKEIGKKAKTAKITKVVFDRNGRLYHGRIKALADAAREAGLEF
jgi:large subunit ribosomal protein L18